jgi:hypothetical protein
MPNFSPNMEMNVRRYIMHRYASTFKSPAGPSIERGDLQELYTM